MNSLILLPALFLALAQNAQAGEITVCKSMSGNSYPIQHLDLAWGKAMPDSDESPFFRQWNQEVAVTISGPRYFRSQSAVAHHSTRSTRLGEEIFTSVNLSENDHISLRSYPEYFNAGHSRLKSASLTLNENTPDQKIIQLSCE